jgi:ribosomal 30S subunit maturation factor RimM
LTNNLFTLGILGKPHALHGYVYLNHDVYFRQFDLTGLQVFINGNQYEIEDFKKHLKDRYLIKFKGLNSISDIEVFRNKNIYINSDQVTSYVSENLPWPGFFVESKLMTNTLLKTSFMLIN